MLQQLQKSRWLRLISYLALCLGLVACYSGGVSRVELDATIKADTLASRLPIVMPTVAPNKTPQRITRSDFNNAWLEGDQCALPCWQGITPHETTLAEALELLNQYPFIKEIEPSDDEEIYFSWDFEERQSIAYGGFLSYKKEPPYIIDYIDLSIATITLGEVIAAYGEPNYVLVDAYTGGLPHGGDDVIHVYEFLAVYLEQGFIIGKRETAFPYLRQISPKQELSFMTTFAPPLHIPLQTPPDVATKKVFRGFDTSAFIPWQGYQSFAFYCEQVRSSDFYNDNECPDYVRQLTPQPNSP
jgi:hypothetical protein